MTTPPNEEDGELRYAEYVLGVLDADARAAVEQELASSSAAAAAEAQWHRRLLPLAEQVAPQMPPERLWQRSRTTLQFDAPAGRASDGLWMNLRLWHWLTLGTGALLAAACAALVFILVSRPPCGISHSSGVRPGRTGCGAAGTTIMRALPMSIVAVHPTCPSVSVMVAAM